MKLKLSALAATALAGSASLASATTISLLSRSPSGDGDSGEATFNYFDPTLGTLNSVTFTVSTSWVNYNGSVTNTSIAPASFTFQLQTLIGPSADYDFLQNNDDQAIDALIGPIDGSGNPNAGTNSWQPMVAPSYHSMMCLYGSTGRLRCGHRQRVGDFSRRGNDLGLFTTNATGTGQFDIVLESVTQQVIVGGGGNAIYNVSTSAGAKSRAGLQLHAEPRACSLSPPAWQCSARLIGMARFSRRRRG